MSSARIVNLTKRFGETTALEDFDLEVSDGEVLVLLGPSGCGKTTLLRSVAGLEQPDAGEIYLKDELVFSRERNISVPPYKRRVGMVFQNYALWPHMNVFNNIAYPLRIKKSPKTEVRRRVREMMKLVQLEGLEERYPHELSGGQQQRAALARALVMEPRLSLLDEPLSNLDAKLREELRDELKRIQRDTRVTTIYVTHDQAEAMALADRLGVMEPGKLIQLGPPMEVYEKPQTEFVARFIGASNLLSGEVRDQDGQRLLQLDRGLGLPLPWSLPLSNGPALVAIRPEEIIITRNGPGLLAKVKSVTYLGNAIEYRLVVGGIELRARTGPGEIYTVGEQVFMRIDRATPLAPRRVRARRHGGDPRRDPPVR